MYYIPSVFKCSTNAPFSQFRGCLQKEGSFNIKVQDPTKAMDVLEAELFTCYLCNELLEYYFPTCWKEIRAWLRKSPVADDFAPTDEDLAIIDTMFEDVLALVEYSLSRLSSYGDDSLEEMMTGVRFSLCHHLRMTQDRTACHKVHSKYNSALFSKKDMHYIPCLSYQSSWVSDICGSISYDQVLSRYSPRKDYDLVSVKEYFEALCNTVDRDYSKPSIFVTMDEGAPCYDSMLCECWKLINDRQQSSTCRQVPLMELVDRLVEICREDPSLSYQAESDYCDMCGDILVPNSALLGYVGKRDTVINSCSTRVSDVARRLGSSVGVDKLKKFMTVVRIIDCIISGSNVEKAGRNYQIVLRFKISTMLRMMDSELFGNQVYLPNMVFVTSGSDPINHYGSYLNDLGFESFQSEQGRSYEKVIDDLESLELPWTSSNRVKNVKIRGCFGYVRSVSQMSPVMFRQCNVNEFSKGTIIVCEPSMKNEIVRAIRFANHSKDGDKDRVWRIVVLMDGVFGTDRPYSSVDVTDGLIVEIGVFNNTQLFDTHSNGILVRTKTALESAMSDLYRNYGIHEGEIEQLTVCTSGEDIVSQIHGLFLKYYLGMSSEIELMQEVDGKD